MLVLEQKRLKPAQKFARDFWVEMQNSVNLSLWFYTHMQEWTEHSQTFHTSDKFANELEKFVQDKLKFSTTFEAIVSEGENTKNEDLRFWCGTYFMFNDAGDYDILRIDRHDDEAIVKFMQKEVTILSFENAELTFEVDAVSATLQFSLPGTMEDKEKDFAKRLDGKQVFTPRCTGTITTEEKSYEVHGKKSCYSQQSAESKTLGDDLNFWSGTYSLVEVTEQREKLWDKELHIWSPQNEAKPVFMQLGEHQLKIETISFYANLLELNKEAAAEISGQFIFERAYTGEKKFSAKLSISGEEKLLLGYLTTGAKYVEQLVKQSTPLPVINTGAISTLLFTTSTLEIITDRLPDTPTGNTVKLQLKAQGGDPLNYTWVKQSADSELSALTIDGTGLVSLSLQDVPANDYSFTVKLISGTDIISKKITLRVTAVPSTPSANAWQIASALITCVGIVVASALGYFLYRKKNMHDHKTSGDQIKWEESKKIFDEMRVDAKNAFEQSYPEEFKKVNNTLDRMDALMKAEGISFKKYKETHTALDKRIKDAFTDAITKANKLMAEKQIEYNRKKAEFRTADAQRKLELRQEMADLLNEIKEAAKTEDVKNEYEEKAKDREDVFEVI